jgi:hypothetical protein
MAIWTKDKIEKTIIDLAGQANQIAGAMQILKAQLADIDKTEFKLTTPDPANALPLEGAEA